MDLTCCSKRSPAHAHVYKRNFTAYVAACHYSAKTKISLLWCKHVPIDNDSIWGQGDGVRALTGSYHTTISTLVLQAKKNGREEGVSLNTCDLNTIWTKTRQKQSKPSPMTACDLFPTFEKTNTAQGTRAYCARSGVASWPV